MKKRVMGLEIETAKKFLNSTGVVHFKDANNRAMDFVTFLRRKFGNFSEKIGQNNADFPARAILPNQGQTYIDRINYAIVELCTPECSSLADLLLHKRVTQAIVVRELREFNDNLREKSGDPKTELHLLTRTTDAFMENVLSCHENYQGRILIHKKGRNNYDCTRLARKILAPFLLARKILEGSGLFFYQSIGGRNRISFCISQRIPFIKTYFSGQSTENRSLIQSKSESLTIGDDLGLREAEYRRWEVLSGESNQTPFCDFIKVGSVQLLLEMVEEGYFFDKKLPLSDDIDADTQGSISKDISSQLNNDLRCQTVYPFGGYMVKLHEILDVYANWMLDYLTSGSYYGPEQKDELYGEKLVVAENIIRAADCFARGDIFALDQDVEWIMKLRWMQDFLKDAVNIEIGDDEPEAWTCLTEVLTDRRTPPKVNLRDFEKNIIWRDSFWHHIDPKQSYYNILEECGLVNPIIIGGRAIDLSIETICANMNSAPMNPPNRALAKKKLWDFMQAAGLKEFITAQWTKCRIVSPSEKNIRKLMDFCGLKDNYRNTQTMKEFPWEADIMFGNPLISDYPEADDIIRRIKRFLKINKKDLFKN